MKLNHIKLVKKQISLTLSILSLTSLAEKIPDDEGIALNNLFVDQKISKTLSIKNTITNGVTTNQPWSGYFWAYKYGALAFRYRDQSIYSLFEKKASFGEVSKIVLEDPFYFRENYIRNENIDQLSPAEKYDLLVGDEEFTLTNSMWKWGKDLVTVPDWRGICDGWSAASISFPRPRNPIEMPIRNGKSITFYPEDIKALGSLLMAESNINVNFIGNCRGKIFSKESKCQEINPATLHLLLNNSIGKSKKEIIFDLVSSGEKWNYPVFKYQFQYFKPSDSWFKKATNTNSNHTKLTDDINHAITPLSQITNKHLLKKRHPSTSKLIGVVATVFFPDDEKISSNEIENSEANDHIKSKVYAYDLELDHNGNILGGKYHNNPGPDYAWTPKSYALNKVKSSVQEINISDNKVIMGLKDLAKEQSLKPRPLPQIVELLFNKAK